MVSDNSRCSGADLVAPGHWLLVCRGYIAAFKLVRTSSADEVFHLFDEFPILVLPEFLSAFRALAERMKPLPRKQLYMERAELLEKLQAMLRESPETYAVSISICGEELFQEWRGDHVLNVRRASSLFREARSILSPESLEYGLCLAHEGDACTCLAELGINSRGYFEDALRIYHDARSVLSGHDQEFGHLLINEGCTRAELAGLGVDSRANLELALDLLDEARSILPKDDLELPSALMNKGGVLDSLADLGINVRANLDQAVHQYSQARSISPHDSRMFAMCLKNEAVTRYKLANLGEERQANLQDSVRLHQQARVSEDATFKFSPFFRTCLMNEANARMELAKMGIETMENMQEAIRLHQETRSNLSPTLPIFAYSLINEGSARQDLASLGIDGPRNLEEACRLYREAADFLRNCGFNLQAIEAYRRLAQIAEREGNEDASRLALEQAIRALEDVRISATLVRDRHAWMEKNVALYKAMVEVCLRLQRHEGAAEYIERGRSRALVDLLYMQDMEPRNIPPERAETYRRIRGRAEELAALLSREKPGIQIKDEERYEETLSSLVQEKRAVSQILRSLEAELRHADPEFFALATPLSLNDMTEIAKRLGRTLVLIWVGVEQGVVFLISPFGEFDRLVLPRLTDAAVKQWLLEPTGEVAPRGWIGSYRQFRERKIKQEDWMKQMLPTLDRLSEELMEPIRLWLKARGEKRVALVVGGPLGLLPLHAARWREGNQIHYFIEEIETVYAPSAWVLKRCLERERRRWVPMLAIADPPAKKMMRLPFSEWEIGQIAALVERKCGTGVFSSLVGDSATLERTAELLPMYPVAHFACHANSDLEQPLQSSLVLTGGNLTLARLLGQIRLDMASLVILSACESGIGYLPDSDCEEYLGLPAGFIVAGAKSVVGSLWAVFDPPTALLMVKLYENLLAGGVGVATALREAQLWLMALNREEAISLVTLPVETVAARLPQRLAENYHVWISQLGERPFAHPYYWAAFQVFGSPEPVFEAPLNQFGS